jgi:proline iminopeptidase
MWLILKITAAMGLIISAVLLITSRTRTRPFSNDKGEKTKGSVAEEVYLNLGGAKQWVLLRGVSVKNPVLVLLHGGPGGSIANGLFRYYNNELEKHFVVVYWEQRGSGRSNNNISADSMTPDQFISDMHELIGYLKNRFDKDNVYIMGESWGSLLGTLYAKKYPEDLAAYIGIGQISNIKKSELMGYEFVLSEAKKRDNKKAIKQLQKIKHPIDHDINDMFIMRKWLILFGGYNYGRSSLLYWVLKILSVDEYSWLDLIRFIRGSKTSIKLLWHYIFETNFFEQVSNLDVPVYLLLGRHDHCVSSVLGAEYFEHLKAPFKKLIWFEKAGHNPPWEDSENFNNAVISEVLNKTQKNTKN